jgi:hypothetical protein
MLTYLLFAGSALSLASVGYYWNFERRYGKMLDDLLKMKVVELERVYDIET